MRMKKPEFVFMVLSAVLTTLIFIVIDEFLPFPVFFPLWVFIVILLFVGIWEALIRGKVFVQVAFLVASLVLTLFIGGLFVGSFEALDISSDSYVDMSYGSIGLQIRNIGLSKAEIQTITVGEITYNVAMFRVGRTELPPLSRGENALLTIRYGSGIYRYGGYEEKLVSNSNVTPSTYSMEGEYPVVIRTRFKEYHFQIEGRLSAMENLEILAAEGRLYESALTASIYINFQLNNTGLAPIFVHSVQIENMLFQFYPSITVPHSEWWGRLEPPRIGLKAYSDGRITCHSPSYPRYYGETSVEVTPEFNLSAFSLNESYTVVFWTLTNQSYETSMTVLSWP